MYGWHPVSMLLGIPLILPTSSEGILGTAQGQVSCFFIESCFEEVEVILQIPVSASAAFEYDPQLDIGLDITSLNVSFASVFSPLTLILKLGPTSVH